MTAFKNHQRGRLLEIRKVRRNSTTKVKSQVNEKGSTGREREREERRQKRSDIGQTETGRTSERMRAKGRNKQRKEN